MRGFWLGYQGGFYKNVKPTTNDCLNAETTANIVKIVDFFDTDMDLNKAFNVVNEGMQIFENVESSCSFGNSVDDLFNFCEANEKNCSPSSFMEHATGNMFALIGKFTEVSEIIKGFPATTTEDLFAQTFTLGNDIGTTIRVLSGF